MTTGAFNNTNLGGLVADFGLANTKMSYEFDPAGNQVTAAMDSAPELGGPNTTIGGCNMC